ncbi:DUF3551 domain-containing protein [Afipia felis]|uniref:Protein of uncharacterized function (DUF3551) n=2 Tax=Afipia felis TaxID=1035 RepID=A0A380WA53_AFIFE|nr:DUF3551 domain-containing protein [Afipia felis]EKS29009.1 hypothetical protein HMPREF9697_01537 [Afipia felis ATCC 53690]SUU77717.1 Protein of uncharacterised function (DUF3551) [Afipia felis]SUU85782.1 Protein of uncharacterised function (DUF3551) [Afipia felis]
MKTYLLTAAALGLATASITSFSSAPANAGTVCLTDTDSPNTYQSCSFYSFGACQASAQGVGGSCVSNPRGDEDSYGYIGGPSAAFGMAYNRYEGPLYHRGYYSSGDRW